MRVIFKLVLFISLIFSSSFAFDNIKVEKLLNIEGIPWGMSFLNKHKLLITQKQGKIFLFNLKTSKLTNIKNPINSTLYGQGGLLDVQVSPSYIKDKWIYFTYSKKINGFFETALSRAKIENNTLILKEELFVSKTLSSNSVHFGSRIAFDENNNIYFSIGDRGNRQSAQDLSNHGGSIIRLKLDGKVPKDNPFVTKEKHLKEIYSYGHRNPQGLFYDKEKKILFSIEHGPRGGDEINIIKKGKNYGWPVISHGKEYWADISIGQGTYKKGMEDAIKVYTPSIAPSSLLVYSGKVFKNYKGNLFAGSLKLRHLNKIVLHKNLKVKSEQRLLKNLNERIRNIVESPEGFLYISTDSGNIYKISLK